MPSLAPEKKSSRSPARNGRPAPELIFGDLWEYDPAPETADPKLKPRYDLFINGEFVAPYSGKYFDSINPANEQKLADIALASADARFMLDEVKLGIPPMFILAEIGNHLAPKAALDIVLSSREFGAAEAREIGVVSRVASELRGETESLLKELRSRDAEVLKAAKRYFTAVSGLPREARAAYALVEQTRFAERRKH